MKIAEHYFLNIPKHQQCSNSRDEARYLGPWPKLTSWSVESRCTAAETGSMFYNVAKMCSIRRERLTWRINFAIWRKTGWFEVMWGCCLEYHVQSFQRSVTLAELDSWFNCFVFWSYYSWIIMIWSVFNWFGRLHTILEPIGFIFCLDNWSKFWWLPFL